MINGDDGHATQAILLTTTPRTAGVWLYPDLSFPCTQAIETGEGALDGWVVMVGTNHHRSLCMCVADLSISWGTSFGILLDLYDSIQRLPLIALKSSIIEGARVLFTTWMGGEGGVAAPARSIRCGRMQLSSLDSKVVKKES